MNEAPSVDEEREEEVDNQGGGYVSDVSDLSVHKEVTVRRYLLRSDGGSDNQEDYSPASSKESPDLENVLDEMEIDGLKL